MSLIRPLVAKLKAYVPGEQPKIPGLIKLNTNENPYPPSPKVLKAVKAAVDGRLRLYPNPTSEKLRERLAELHGCQPENILVGNGSDEVLALATRCFPEPALGSRANGKKHDPAATIQFFTPSYSLYPVLAAIHGSRVNAVPLNKDFGLPTVAKLRAEKRWEFNAALSFITTPNAPSGRGYSTAELESVCRSQKGVVLLDEAYVDFAQENAAGLALKYPNVLVARTFSKAFALCFQRVGYCLGARELIEGLEKIKDSYNVNGLGQVAAVATLDDLPYYRANFARILSTRQRLIQELGALGFQVCPSQSNFLLVEPPAFPAAEWLEKLRQRKILVRWFSDPRVQRYLRVTVGSDVEANALIRAAKAILRTA